MDLETRLAALERQQSLIQARQDLWQTMARYARGIDEQREDELAAMVTDDVVLETQPWTQGPLVGKALALKALRNYRRAFQGPRHFITNHQLPSTTMAQPPATPTGWWCRHGRSNRTVAGAATSGSFAVKVACGRSAACS